MKHRIKNKKKFILIGYRDRAIKLYNPKRNKFKLFLLFGLVGVCLITPLTNWIIGLIGLALNKNPIWLYR